MKRVFILILLLKVTLLFSTQEIGLDSGYKSIIIYNNKIKTDIALLIIGGIHGDERETVDVVNYLSESVISSISTYYIPNINPTLSYIATKDNNFTIIEGKRGYLNEHLDDKGFVKKGSNLSLFSKDMYYRIFYGNDNTYKNGIKYYIDPNRDFYNKRLPSTRVLLEHFKILLERHKKVIVLSIHSYMPGGRIYPEYIISNDKIIIPGFAKKIANAFRNGSGFIYKDFYEPALPIKNRFKGELLSYTGSIENLIAFDIELDKIEYSQNRKKVLLGVHSILDILYKE